MKTYKQLLEAISDSKIDLLKNKYKTISTDHDPDAMYKNIEDIIKHFSTNADPTEKAKYIEWILSQYKKGNIKQEDDQDIKKTLVNFENYKGKLAEKNINKYDHIDDLKTVLEPHAFSDPNYQDILPHPDAPLIFSKNGVEVRKLNSKEASRHYFRGGSVCTARMDNACMHDEYSKHGQLYHLKAKDSQGNTKDYNIFLTHDPLSRPNEFSDKFNKHIKSPELVKNNPELRNVEEWQFKDPEFSSDKNKKKIDSLKTLPVDELENIIKDKNEHPNFRALAIKDHYGKVSDKILKEIIHDSNEHEAVRNAAIRTKKVKLSKEEVHDLFKKNEGFFGIGSTSAPLSVRISLLQHYAQHFNDDDKNRILNNKNEDVAIKGFIIDKTKIDPSYVEKVMSDNSNSNESQALKYAILSSYNNTDRVSLQHIRDIINHNTQPPLVEKALTHKHAYDIPIDEIEKLANDTKSPNIMNGLLHNPNLSSSAIDKLVKRTSESSIHRKALDHPNVDPETTHYILTKANDDLLNIINSSVVRNAQTKTLNNLAGKVDLRSRLWSFIGNASNATDETRNIMKERVRQYADMLHEKAKSTNSFEDLSNIVNNPYTASHTLHHIANKIDDPNINTSIILHKNVLPETLHHIAQKTSDFKTLEALLESKRLKSETLNHIADKTNDPYIHEMILRHPNATLETRNIIHNRSKNAREELDKLAKSTTDISQLHKIVQNTYTSGHTLHHIAQKTNDPDLSDSIIYHSNVLPETLHHIAQKINDRNVDYSIANHSKALPETLHHITQKYIDPNVTYPIINHPNVLPETLHHIAKKTNDPHFDYLIAGNKKTRSDTLQLLAARAPDDYEIRHRIIAHPNVTTDALHSIAALSGNNDKHLLLKIINHPKVSSGTLHAISKKSNNAEVHRGIINNPNVHPDTLHHIAQNTSDIQNLKEIAKSQKALPTTLHHIAEKTNDRNVHEEIVNNPNTSEETKHLINNKYNND